MLAVLLIAMYLITLNVSTPWQSLHEDNGLTFETAAISHIRFGLAYTKGQDVLDQRTRNTMGQGIPVNGQFQYLLKGPVEPVVYGDHPPALGLTVAASFLVFGYHFWAVRLVPILYTLIGLLLFYRLVSRLFDIAVARVASALYATFPITAYFGRNVSHEAPTLCWGLVVLTGYFSWRASGHKRWLALMAMATVIGGYYGWPMYYLVVILFAVDWAAEKKPSRALALATLVPAVVTFALVALQIDWALGWHLGSLKRIFLIRISGGSLGSAFSWTNVVTFLNQEDFGQWTQLAAPLVAVFLAGRASSEGWSRRMQMVAICGLWGLSHVLIFRHGAWLHAYWQFYLIPFYAIAIGWAAVGFTRAVVLKPLPRGAALVFLIYVVIALNLPGIINLYSNYGRFAVRPLIDFWQ